MEYSPPLRPCEVSKVIQSVVRDALDSRLRGNDDGRFPFPFVIPAQAGIQSRINEVML